MTTREYRVRYARWIRPLLVATGLGPRRVKVELSDTGLTVGAGVWFTAVIPRSSIRAVARQRDAWWAIGVHTDFRGAWLVNGSPRGIVMLGIDPPARARMAGIPVTVKRLALSLEEPDGFVAALTSSTNP